MDNKTLLEWLKAYFPATNGLTLKEIGVRTRYMNDDARHKLKNCIVECITNRFGRVSFAEIYEVAKERGIDFQRPEPEPEYDVQPLSSGRLVTCPACGDQYTYQQGSVDCCPVCGFEYYEHLIYENASPADRNGALGAIYSLKLKFHQGLGEGSKTLEKPA